MRGKALSFIQGRGGAFALLGLVLLLFYWNTLVGFPGGRTFFWEDFLYQNYPYRAFEAEEVRNGSFPFWNPYQFGGMPFAADIQAASFYPPNLLLSLVVHDGRLDPWWVELEGIVHAFLGGIFLFALLRSRTGSVYASLLAAVGWALSGFFVVRMIHLNTLCVVAWSPLILHLLIRAVERRSLSAAVLAGLFFGVSLLGGSPQYSLFLLFLFGLYIFYVVVRPPGGETGCGRLKPLLYLALLSLIGFGVASIQLLPTEELSRLSLRSEMTYEKSTECSFEPASLPTLLIPKLFGTTAGRNNGGYWGPGRYFYFWELCAYSGVVVLLLASVALVYRPGSPLNLFFAVLALFGFLLGLGMYGPLHPLFYKFLPVYDRFRCPGRALLLTGFAFVFLAGRGAALIGSPPPGRGRWKAVGTVVAALLFSGLIGYFLSRPGSGGGIRYPAGAEGASLRAFLLFLAFLLPAACAILFWARGRKGLGRPLRSMLLALLIGELFYYGFGFNDGGVDPDRFYRSESTVIDALRKDTEDGLYRVKTRAPEGLLLPRNMGSINRIPSVDGYNQLKLQRYEDIQVSPSIPFDRVIDLLGVRVFTRLDRESGSLRFVRNNDALPKAFFVGSAERPGSAEAILQRLGDPSFDPSAVVLLENDGAEFENPGGAGRAVVSRRTSNRIEIGVECDGPGYLVLNEIHYPAWRVAVDGEEREPLEANHALRAVRLTEGEHRVVWEYRSSTFRAGAAISLSTLALSIGLLFFAGKRRNDGPVRHLAAAAGKEGA